LLVGFVAGGLPALDEPLSYEWLPDEIRLFPFLVTAVLGATALALYHMLWRLPSIWRRRMPIAIALVLFGTQTGGIDFGPINILNIAIVVLFGLWVLERFRNPDAPWAPPAFGSLAVALITCVLFASLNRPPVEAAVSWLRTLPTLLMLLPLADSLSARRRVRGGLRALLWTAGVSGLIGLVQTALYFGLGVEFTFVPEDLRYRGDFLRTSGLQLTPHAFALSLVVALVIAVHLLLSPVSRGGRWRLLLLTAVTLPGIGLSLVRGTWVALAGSVALLPFIVAPRLTLHWIAFGGLLVGTGLAPLVLKELHEYGSEEPAVVGRIDLLQKGIAVLREYPWSGVGLDAFALYSETVEGYPLHNAPMQIATEIGIPGALVFLTVLAWVGVRLFIALRNARRLADRAALRALLAGYVALIISIQTEPHAFNSFLWVYLTLAEAAARVLGPTQVRGVTAMASHAETA